MATSGSGEDYPNKPGPILPVLSQKKHSVLLISHNNPLLAILDQDQTAGYWPGSLLFIDLTTSIHMSTHTNIPVISN